MRLIVPAARTAAALLGLLSLFLAPPTEGATKEKTATLLVVLAGSGDSERAVQLREARARRALAGAGMVVLGPRDVRERRGGSADWPGMAGPPADGERRVLLEALEQAHTHLLDMDFEDAKSRYRETLQRVDEHPELLTEAPEAAKRVFDHTLRYVLLLQRTGDDEPARKTLRALVRRSPPTLTPSPAEHPPELIEAYDAARAEANEHHAELRVTLVGTATDSGAATPLCRIYVDGRRIADTTHVATRLPRGRHRVQARCGAHWSTVRTVRLPGRDDHLLLDPLADGKLRETPEGKLRLSLAEPSEARLAAAAAALASASGIPLVAFADQGEPTVRVFSTEHGTVRVVALAPPKPLPSRPRRRIWTWVALGVGAGLMGAGGYFHWATRDETRRIDAGEERLAERSRDLTLTGVLYGLGAAALVTSVVLFFTEPDHDARDDQPETTVPTFHFYPTAGGLLLQGRF